MRRTALVISLLAVVALTGCSGFGVGPTADQSSSVPEDPVTVADADPGATAVNHTLRVAVTDSTAGSELGHAGATYPRDRFVVDSASHDRVSIGVDTDGDGAVDRTFDEGDVSGVNSNDYSFDVTLDTGHTLREGDVVVVGYPAVDSPSEPGEYDVELRLNHEQTATGTITVE